MAVGPSAVEDLVMLPEPDFWNHKRVVLTGHTGFKGGWLALWLNRLGARVTGIALPPRTSPNLFEQADVAGIVDSHYCDIRTASTLAALIRGAAPEIVLHLAAQPLVRVSYRQPLETYATNVMGTAHVLDALRDLTSARVAVVVTTDKVYLNHECAHPFREDDRMGGHDPYSASKAAAEIVTASYRDAFLAEQGVAVATARAGNVIGGGDWSEDRLIPDAVRAWGADNPMEIRHPEAIRPWQHVLEPLSGYLILAEKLWGSPTLAGAYNFGPDAGAATSVCAVVDLARKSYGRGAVVYRPSEEGLHEASCLALDAGKARLTLGVEAHWPLAESVSRTMNWYRRFASGSRARDLCVTDIAEYEAGPWAGS